MNSSPITTWDGAAAVFTFADNPSMVMILLGACAAVTVFSIIFGAFHEKECYMKVEKNGR